MKKVLVILCMVMILLSRLSFHKIEANAASEPTLTTDTKSFTDIVNFTANKSGEMWTDHELADFGVKHGNVANGSINKFSTYTFDSSTWKGTLGSSSDNAYTESNWKIYTRKNDGFIFQFTAKYPIKVSIVRSVIGGDWVADAKLNVYKQTSNELITIKNVAITGSTTAEEFGTEVDLAVGETLYWEFVFQWDDARNMINMPSVTFTYDPTIKPVEPADPNAPSKTDESVSFTDMVIYTAKQGGENWTDHTLVDFGVKHGNVANGNISKFSTYTFDSAAWAATLGSSEDNAYAEAHWKIFTRKNDGFIFEFTAKYPVKVTIERSVIGGDWVADAKLNVYKQTDDELITVKNVAITGNTTAEEFGAEVELEVGETLYWEFVFQWDDLRHMINMPTATFTYKQHECKFSDEWTYDEDSHWKQCRCGEKDAEAEHTWLNADCKNPKTCSVCGAKTGEPLAHTPAEAVKENEVASTCKVAGSYDLVVYCSVCEEELSRETKSLELAQHTEEVVAGKASTCKEAGLTDGKKCSVCGDTLVAQEVLDKTEHIDSDNNNECDNCGEKIGAETPNPEPNEPSQNPEEPKKGCEGSVFVSIFGLLAITGATIVLRKKREE